MADIMKRHGKSHKRKMNREIRREFRKHPGKAVRMRIDLADFTDKEGVVDWERYYKAQDKLLSEEHAKRDARSKRQVVIGLATLMLVMPFVSVNDNDNSIYLDKMILIIDILFVIAAFVLFCFAMRNWGRAKDISAERYNWTPCKEEEEFIDKRFDNDLVKVILSAISVRDTYSITVKKDTVTILNRDGEAILNFSRCGFNRLTNYDTKQLSYYIARHALTEGYTIYQTKSQVISNVKSLGGVTDYGGTGPRKEKRFKQIRTLLVWLFNRIAEILRIKLPSSAALNEGPVSDPLMSSGQLILNKGFQRVLPELDTL